MSVSQQAPKKVAIIGAGVTGLSLAYQIQSTSNLDVNIYSADDHFGGIIQSEPKDSFLLEHGPDCFLAKNKEILNLVNKLNLDSDLISTQAEFRRSYILKNNTLLQVPSGFYLMAPKKFIPFLKSPLLSWPAKIRSLCEYFVSAQPDIEDESLASFVHRRFGPEMLHRIAQPMIAGIYTGNAQKLSLQSTMPQFLELEKKYGSVLKGLRKEEQLNVSQDTSGPRYGMFLSFQNGMSTLIHRLVENIPSSRLHTGKKLISSTHNGQSWDLRFSDGSTQQSDILCICCSSLNASSILKKTSPELSKSLGDIQYASSAIVNMAFKKSSISHLAPGMGFVVPQIEQRNILACSFLHQKFNHRAPKDSVLLRVFMGGAMQEMLLESSENELIDIATREISSILKINEPPIFATIKKWTHGLPQFEVGHQKRLHEIDSLRKKLPHLYLLGSGYKGVGIPDLVQKAFHVSQELSSTS